MSSKSIRVGLSVKAHPIPENCQFVGINKFICEYDNEIEECEIIEGNKLFCGLEYKECILHKGGIACKEKVEIVDWKGQEQATQDVFIGHAYLVVIAAILSLTLTQIIKPFIFKTCNEKSDAVIRLFAVLTGAGIAYSLSNPFEMIDVYLGASAGAINAFVIKMFKAKVKKSLGVDDTHKPDQ
jgi:hypothetical protein